MTVTYSLTRDDFLRYYRYTLQQSFKMPPSWACACGVVLALIGFIGIITSTERRLIDVFTYVWLFYGMVLLGLFVAWNCSIIHLRVMFQKQAERNPDILAETRVTAEPFQISFVSAYGESHLRWQAVRRVTSDMHSIYVALGHICVIIPISAFDTLEEAQTFIELCQNYVSSSRAVVS